MTDISLDNYYYGSQLKRYATVFTAIFAGLKVSVGKNDFNSSTNLIKVPAIYGDQDRVVMAIISDNTQNSLLRLPMITTYMAGIELDDTLRVGTGSRSKKVRPKMGGVIPDDLVIIDKRRPIPYRLSLEATICASNQDQHCQMLEQICMLFDPNLEIQISDTYADWTKKTVVTLEGIENQMTYPAGQVPRLITTQFNFSMPIQLSPPFNLRTDFIKEMKLKLTLAGPTDDIFEVAEESARVSDPEDYETIIDADHDGPFVVSQTPVPSPTPSNTLSLTPSPTTTRTPSPTPTPSHTTSVSVTPTATLTVTPTPSITPSPVP